MSRRSQICVIPHLWTLDDYALSPCKGGSHIHISAAELRDKERKSLVAWRIRGEKQRVVTLLPTSTSPGPGSTCTVENTGLSNQVGAELAMAIYRHQAWGQVMFADIKHNALPAEETLEAVA